MTAITYDFIKKLEQAGFTPAQVEVLTVVASESSKKPEINRVEKDLTVKIDEAETRLEKRMDYRFDLIEKQFDSLRSLLKWLIAISVALIPSITTWFSWVAHMAAK